MRMPWHSLGWALVGTSIGLFAGYWIGFQHGGASLDLARERALGHGDSLSDTTASRAATVQASPVDRASWQSGNEPPSARPAQPDETTRHSSGSKPTGEDVEGRSPAAASASRQNTREQPVLVGSPRAAPAGRALATSSSRRTSESDSGDRFAAEVALLQRAERALRAGEGALALSFLDELERDFPGSSLRVERDAARVLARCQMTRTGSAAEREPARKAALELLSRGPSAYAGRVRELCELAAERTSATAKK